MAELSANLAQLQEVEQRQREEQERSIELQHQGHYVHQHMDINQLDQLKAQDSLSEDVKSVRQIVSRKMPQAYERIDEIRQSEETDQRAYRLHHSRGKKFVDENGARVLEFDMAGSGFQQFRTMHKGFFGKMIIGEDGQEEAFKKRVKVSWYNKYLSWIKGIRSVDEINQENEKITAYNRQLMEKYGIDENEEQLKQKHEEMLNEQYGEKQTINGKEMKHVRKKVSEDERKTRITMAGPLALGGASNSGDYSIENLRNYMLAMGADYLENIFNQWNGPSDEHDIHIIIRGHSRGGVASVEGAMMIKHWVKENYFQYRNRVKFELIQYDPVPGFGSYEEHANVDHLGQETVQKDGFRMEPLGEEAQTTVIYSVHTDHKVFFTPQIIKGAKRILLTPFKHSVDLGATDATQEQKHRRGYTDARTGEVYRSSGINEMDEGVYIVDEHNTLIRLNNYAEAEAIIKEMVEGNISQDERHKIMLDVAKEWFDRH